MDDAADWGRDRVPESRQNRGSDLADAEKFERTDAKTQPLEGNLPIANSTVEAPSPNRRSLSPPGAFVAPPNAREIVPNSIPSSAALSDDPSAVVLANHETAAHENSSGIELTAGQRQPSSSATGTLNPWDRSRGLTNNHDANVPATNDSANSAGPRDQRIESHRDQAPVQPRLNGNAPNRQLCRKSASGSRHHSTTALVGSVFAERDEHRRNPTGNLADGFRCSRGVRSVERPVGECGATRFQQFPADGTQSTISDTSRKSAAQLWCSGGRALAIAAFASSLDLERLITQTTVEAAAVIPGDNDVSRQLYLRKHVQLRMLNLIAGQTDRALAADPRH